MHLLIQGEYPNNKIFYDLFFSLIYFTNETNYQHEILSMERRPCEEDMLADLENDLELIRQEMCF